MNDFWYWIIYVVSISTFSAIAYALMSFFDKKTFEWKVHDLKFYLNHFGFNNNTYMFTYNDTKFEIAVSYEDNVHDYYETTKVIINGEEAVTIYSLEHLFTKSRRVDFNIKRHDYEIKKILKIARKNLKKKYSNEFNKRYDEYTYFTNLTGKDIDN